ncbi:MAG TPA: GNAT family N-acetyltransferase [Thermoflexia bacterium]|nr:GNAT family N-acetyltransferase [Thermoflexia bacterium]
MSKELRMEEFAARPGISGLVFRPLRGEEDYGVIADVLSRSNEADGIDYMVTVEQVANWFAHWSDFDPQRDAIFAEVNGEPVGYGRVGWRREADGAWIYNLYVAVVAEYRRSGIWDAMMDYCERRLRQIAAGHDLDGPRLLSAYADDRQQAWTERLRRRGYRPVRYFYEMIHDRLDDLPPAPMPPGLEIRPVKPEHYRAVWEANEEAFRDHWGYSESKEEDYRRWLTHPYFAPDLWQVAWDGDQVAGVAINLIDEEENRKFNRRRGYVHDLSVRRPWRGRGLGRALLVRSLAMFRDRGMAEVTLNVDTENPTGALRLYESVGFRPVHRSAVWRKPMGEEDTNGTTDP